MTIAAPEPDRDDEELRDLARRLFGQDEESTRVVQTISPTTDDTPKDAA
jgi:hypothetical protein